MDNFLKILLLDILLGLTTTLISADQMQEASYCEHFTHVYVNVSNPKENVIITRAEDDGETYSADLYCAWGLHAEPSHRVHVTVVQYDLGEVSDDANCYDHTYIAIKQDDIQDDYDWLNAEPGMYFRMCGSQAPPEFSSADINVIIEFNSDANDGDHKGVEFVATEFPVGTCAPGWTELDNMCYKLFTTTVTWNLAQEYCTISQANLVSIETQQEADAIQDMIASSESITADTWVWLGQYYPRNKDTLEWIDESSTSFNLSSKWPENDPDMSEEEDMYRCSAVAANGMKTYQSCHDSSTSYAYICKAAKDNNIQLFGPLQDGFTPKPTGIASTLYKDLGMTVILVCLNLYLL